MQSSNMAVFTDAGVSVDQTNYPNIFTSYYIYGAAVALALDLTLRTQFNSSLDIFMQEMWKRHGKPFIPYTVADMEKALAAITNPGFAKSFFGSYIYRPGVPDYARLLSFAGFELRPSSPGQAWLGNARFQEKTGLAILNNTTRNTALYDAGLDIDDEITSIGSRQIKTTADYNDVLKTLRPGDKVQVTYLHRGKEKKSELTVKENPAFAVATYESSGKPVTPQILSFRRSWLGAQ